MSEKEVMLDKKADYSWRNRGLWYMVNADESAYKIGFKDGYTKALAEASEWHDLRKNPDDLPKEEKVGQTFIVAFAFNEQTQKYYCFDCAEYIDKGRFITHTVNGSGEHNAYRIIAWKEIMLPEEADK